MIRFHDMKMPPKVGDLVRLKHEMISGIDYHTSGSVDLYHEQLCMWLGVASESCPDYRWLVLSASNVVYVPDRFHWETVREYKENEDGVA